MTQELTFVYTYHLLLANGESLEGGSHLELEVDEESPLSPTDAFAIAFEAATQEIQSLLDEKFKANETELTISIQKMTIR